MANEWTPKSDLAELVYDVGFKYDPAQDIIYSRMDAWQRKFGYAYAYDLAAPVTISAIIDCEPFFFKYNNKNWMIELWKGQYGLETGGEIGVYVARGESSLLDPLLGKRPDDDYNSRFFECANDDELLNLSFTLKRNGEELFKRESQDHWWLTGFKWGVLSEPEDLTMELSIGFKSTEMKNAFVEAVKHTGYQNIEVDTERVSFTFDQPRTDQPRDNKKYQQFVELAHHNNKQIVEKYNALGFPNNDPNQISGKFIDYFENYKMSNMIQEIIKQLVKQGMDAFKLTDVFGFFLKKM